MRRCAGLLAAGGLALLGAMPSRAQSPGVDSSSARSRSGQFTAHVLYHAAPDPYLAANPALVRVDPAVVVVSCERVRDLVWRELEIHGPWAAKVSVLLYPALSPDEVVTVVSDRFKNGWQYQLYLPQLVERGRYVRALTQVVLLELANRSAGAHGAEIPTWLVEGLAQQLLASSDARIILSAPEAHPAAAAPGTAGAAGANPANPAGLIWRGAPTRSTVAQPPLARAHEILSSRPLLTFQELSWPDDAQLSGEAGEVYRHSAQLFVSRLLSLPGGRASLRAMLAALPAHYNWQFAFLPAFHAHFERPLDAEKWWAIQAAEFTGRRLDQTWARQPSLQKLEEAMRTPIDVRLGTNDLPLHSEARLQNVVGDWNSSMQTPVLKAKLAELDALRAQVSRDLVPLVDGYRQTLAEYIRKRDKPGLVLPFRKQATQRRNVERTVAQLNALDVRRQILTGKDTYPVDPVLADDTSPAARNLGGTFSPLPSHSPGQAPAASPQRP